MSRNNIIVVGTGDYYVRVLSRVLSQLEEENFANVVATVDITERRRSEYLADVEHRVRTGGRLLSSLLSDFSELNPIVFLGHANPFHTPDAIDLVKNGYRVIIQKPYCINHIQFSDLLLEVQNSASAICMLESCQTWNAVLLAFLAGKIKECVFSSTRDFGDLCCDTHENPLWFWGKIEELIGAPRYVQSNILEGSAEFGRLDHRGSHLIDLEEGGGMIQDLGLHAIAPLLTLESYLGQVVDSNFDGTVRIARCQEYLDMVGSHFQIPKERIGETYAEIRFTTQIGIPITVLVGKYVLGRNERNIVIVGDHGILNFDMTRMTASVITNYASTQHLLRLQSLPPVQYPTIKDAVNELMDNSVLTFNVSANNLRTQEFILNILKSIRYDQEIPVYSQYAKLVQINKGFGSPVTSMRL